jgi:hypothetical protein
VLVHCLGEEFNNPIEGLAVSFKLHPLDVEKLTDTSPGSQSSLLILNEWFLKTQKEGVQHGL